MSDTMKYRSLIAQLYLEIFDNGNELRYDAWQVFKELLILAGYGDWANEVKCTDDVCYLPDDE